MADDCVCSPCFVQVTDIYEYGWGQSFHFSPKLPGAHNMQQLGAAVHKDSGCSLGWVKHSQVLPPAQWATWPCQTICDAVSCGCASSESMCVLVRLRCASVLCAGCRSPETHCCVLLWFVCAGKNWQQSEAAHEARVAVELGLRPGTDLRWAGREWFGIRVCSSATVFASLADKQQSLSSAQARTADA